MAQIPQPGAFLNAAGIVSSIGLVQGAHAADLGCGSGYMTMALARAVGKDGAVTAVDVMVEPLEAVRAKAEAAGLTQVREVRADLEVLGGTKIPDGSQDLSALVNILFQSQKKEAILAEAVRILKPGGKLLIVNWKKGAGGFGPPDELRSDDGTLQSLGTGAGVRFERAIEAGQYFTAFLFTK